MARRLRAAVEQAKAAGTRLDAEEAPVLDVAGCEINAGEAEDPARFFEVCVDRGYAILGWW